MLSRKKGQVRPGKKGLPGHPDKVGSLLPGFHDEAVHHGSVGDPGKLGSRLSGAAVHPGLGLPLGKAGRTDGPEMPPMPWAAIRVPSR